LLFIQTNFSPYFLQYLLTHFREHFVSGDKRNVCCLNPYMVFRYISLHFSTVSVTTNQFHLYILSKKHQFLLCPPPLPLCSIWTQDTQCNYCNFEPPNAHIFINSYTVITTRQTMYVYHNIGFRSYNSCSGKAINILSVYL
jgi:hypothetical protein